MFWEDWWNSLKYKGKKKPLSFLEELLMVLWASYQSFSMLIAEFFSDVTSLGKFCLKLLCAPYLDVSGNCVFAGRMSFLFDDTETKVTFLNGFSLALFILMSVFLLLQTSNGNCILTLYFYSQYFLSTGSICAKVSSSTCYSCRLHPGPYPKAEALQWTRS